MTTDPPLPARPTRPGQILLRELIARGWTQKELAERMGRSEQLVSEIVCGKKAITPATAITFERILGPSAEFWLRLEMTWRLHLERERQREDAA